MKHEFITAFSSYLKQLIKEIELFPNDESLWMKSGGEPNSPGNLILHLEGNLNHFIGAALGNSSYKRNRDAEFTLSGFSKTELIKRLTDTEVMVSKALQNLSDERLLEKFPEAFSLTSLGEMKVNTAYMLAHLLAHLSYHVGQINYHRRILLHN